MNTQEWQEHVEAMAKSNRLGYKENFWFLCRKRMLQTSLKTVLRVKDSYLREESTVHDIWRYGKNILAKSLAKLRRADRGEMYCTYTWDFSIVMYTFCNMLTTCREFFQENQQRILKLSGWNNTDWLGALMTGTGNNMKWSETKSGLPTVLC